MRYFGLMSTNDRRIGTDSFDEYAGGQQIAFDVRDVPAARFQKKLALGIVLGFGAQLRMAQQLQIHQSITQGGKGNAEH